MTRWVSQQVSRAQSSRRGLHFEMFEIDSTWLLRFIESLICIYQLGDFCIKSNLIGPLTHPPFELIMPVILRDLSAMALLRSKSKMAAANLRSTWVLKV